MRDFDTDDLLALHGWERAGETTTEGEARRTEVALETGDRGLLYVWDSDRQARRAARAHEIGGHEMFAVPEKVVSGPGWLVVQKPDGVPARALLGEDGFAGDDRRARDIVAGVGQSLRKLHQLPTPKGCGDLLEKSEEDDEQRRWLTFSGYVAHQLEWFSEGLRDRELTEKDVERLSKSAADLRHELSAFHPRNPSCICHGQFGIDHVWLDESGREVVGITGFERAAILPREADIAYLLWIDGLAADETLTRAFYDGYGAARTMDVQRRERFYRRLVAFQALFGAKGEVPVTEERLIELTTAVAV